MIATSETKICNRCGVEQPITEFRRRKRGTEQRQSDCRECYNQAMRDYRAEHRQKTLRQFPAGLRPKRGLRHVEQFLASVAQRFGGWSNFVKAWNEHFEHAQKTDPGSPRVMRTFKAIFELIAAADQAKRAGQAGLERTIEDLMDEELDATIEALSQDV